MARKKQNINTKPDKAYETFLKDLSIADLRLISSSSRFDPKADMKLRRAERAVVRAVITASYQLAKVTQEFFDSAAEFKLTVEGSNIKANPITIECVFLGHFHLTTPIKKEMAERFTEADFRLVVWPYLRQFVQDITGKMGVPPLLIPLSNQETT
jgi:preprotein translocase subunit SecB